LLKRICCFKKPEKAHNQSLHWIFTTLRSVKTSEFYVKFTVGNLKNIPYLEELKTDERQLKTPTNDN